MHPGDPTPLPVVIALAAGIVLFVGSSALAYWRLHHRLLVGRITVLAVLTVALAAVSGLSLSPAWPLAIVASALAVLVIVGERSRPTCTPSRVRPDPPGSSVG